jgi:lipopolysaccharide/colanic/teichoic acid biosynthesis glycosyltransferase
MRLLDFLAAAIGLVILSPALAIVGLGVKLTSPGPIFYRALRVGKGGKLFRLYKFRTMVVGADRVGPGITVAGDRRITRLGQFLRRTKIDELPQLLNVLRGEMSLVGPRPEDPHYVALYTPEQRRVLAARPGITSPASLAFRDEATSLQGPDWERKYVQEIMPCKLEIELRYLAHRSALTDLSLILATIRTVAAR